MTMYMITAHVSNEGSDGITRNSSLPTFFLNSDIQGIKNELHAKAIAEEMIKDILYVSGIGATNAKISIDVRPLIDITGRGKTMVKLTKAISLVKRGPKINYRKTRATTIRYVHPSR